MRWSRFELCCVPYPREECRLGFCFFFSFFFEVVHCGSHSDGGFVVSNVGRVCWARHELRGALRMGRDTRLPCGGPFFGVTCIYISIVLVVHSDSSHIAACC